MGKSSSIHCQFCTFVKIDMTLSSVQVNVGDEEKKSTVDVSKLNPRAQKLKACIAAGQKVSI